MSNTEIVLDSKEIKCFQYPQILKLLSDELGYDLEVTDDIWVQLTGEHESNSFDVVWIEGLQRRIEQVYRGPLEAGWCGPMWSALRKLDDACGVYDTILIQYP